MLAMVRSFLPSGFRAQRITGWRPLEMRLTVALPWHT
jgi:hypothetical protein